MPRELFSPSPEVLEYRDYTPPSLAPTEVRISSEFGAAKHGTEFLHFSGKAPFAGMDFDGEKRMFVPIADKERGYSKRAGNMIVGTVTETGTAVTRVKQGDRVYCNNPFREVVTIDESRARPLQVPMTETDAVCTDPAHYALGAVRDARVAVGDTVVIFGLGAIGLLAVQFLKLCGCAEIIAVDPIEKRRLLAARFGATRTLDPTADEPGAAVHAHLGGKGADVALEISGSYQALQSALRSVAMCGRVVTVGFYKGNNAPLQLSMEWHHNRLQLISSMPDWGNPLRDHPLWDRERMQSLVVRLFRERKLTSEGIVDPIVSFNDAAACYLKTYRDQSSSVKLGVRFAGNGTV